LEQSVTIKVDFRILHLLCFIVFFSGCGIVESDPLRSPFSGQLALVSDRDGSADIFVYDLASGQLTNLTNTPGEDESDPAWSPDGRQLVFSTPSSEAYSTGRTFIMQADGSQRRFLASGVTPAWSPDGRHIYVSSFSSKWPNARGVSYWVGEIYSLDLTGDNLQRLTGKGDSSVRETSADTNPAASPDGQYILYQHNNSSISHVWRINADGSDPVLIDQALLPASGGASSKDPVWSPDGILIALFASQDIYQGTGMGLYIGDKNGEEWRLVESGFIGNPTWSPDGLYIAYDVPYLDSTTWAVMVTRADGSGEAVVLTPTDGHSYYAPAWRPE
jgi:Tol biopolymer transport system component